MVLLCNRGGGPTSALLILAGMGEVGNKLHRGFREAFTISIQE